MSVWRVAAASARLTMPAATRLFAPEQGHHDEISFRRWRPPEDTAQALGGSDGRLPPFVGVRALRPPPGEQRHGRDQ